MNAYARCVCSHIAYHHIAADGQWYQDCYFRFEAPTENTKPCDCQGFKIDNLWILEEALNAKAKGRA